MPAAKGRPLAKRKPSALAQNAMRKPSEPPVTYKSPVKPPVKSAVNNDVEVARGRIAPKYTSIELEMSVLRALNKFPMGYSEQYIPIISLVGKKHVERKPRKHTTGFDYHITQAGKAAYDKYQKNKGNTR